MEFTKENVISVLKDARGTIFKLAKENREKYEEYKDERGLSDFFEGRAEALESTSFYLDDIIEFINDYLITTEDVIDKENKNE